MAAQTGKSSLLAKYGSRVTQAAQKHAADPVDYGNMRLPPGISNGIAQLRECTFAKVAPGKTNAGEVYFRAAGVVIEPHSVMVNGVEVTCAGLHTSIFEMVCDTTTRAGVTTTVEQHVASIQNEMKKFDPNLDVVDLDSAAAALKEVQPYFRFSTSLGKEDPKYPDRKVFENWHGSKGLENYSPPEQVNGQAVTDNTSQTTAVDHTNANADGAADDSQEENDGPLDVASLLQAANADDEGAQLQLRERAIAAGHSEESVDGAKSWQAVADMIDNPPDEAGEEEESPAEEPWKKGDNCGYRPIDAKTRKPVKKAIQCEITAVDSKSGAITLKRLDTKAVIKGVDQDALEEI